MNELCDLPVGGDSPVYIVGEIGINHNGDVEIAKELMRAAASAGMNAVKFQKRNPLVSTPQSMRATMRMTPWGEMSYLDYRLRIELGHDEYEEIAAEAARLGIDWFASPWDVDSVAFLEDFDVKCHKVASASLTDFNLLRATAATGKPILRSTGMSTIDDVVAAVEITGKDRLALLHTTSTYPMPPEEANLFNIPMLQKRFGVPVGYSGHETGLQISLAAVALGAKVVERHITLDRAMWGSDQAASLEPPGFQRLVRDIRIIERALGTSVKEVRPGEKAKIVSLRGE